MNPAVSVIIPLYNAEKYLGDCLESILKQTFQDFEVIVVDDCSTDSSCAIVEDYIPKFGGRLKLSAMEKNSGSGALPRNKGFELSRGEYVYFVDADDMLIETALEELYTLAKDYDAGVVYCEKYYRCGTFGENIKVNWRQSAPFVDEPTFDTENLAERVKGIANRRYWVTPWCKLVRRDLMAKSGVHFPHCQISEDDIWTYGLVLHARKFLRVPNAVYIYRDVETSMHSTKRSPQKFVNFWMNPLILGLKTLDNFMSNIPFFQLNPSYRYAVLETFVNFKYNNTFEDSFNLPPYVMYETMKHKYGELFGEYDVSMAAICTYAATLYKIYKINALQLNQRIAELEAELEAEINRLKSIK